jgi:hypothetical protein
VPPCHHDLHLVRRHISPARHGLSVAFVAAEDYWMRELIHLYRQREEGAIGYILLWIMGVPASLLFLVFLLRGCN